ncbi:MAG: hypothetical protein KDD46_08040, partial [Bdellovibrionales bacterium]|nr:hypothetical protein [Bdellovibrionales bacterium]
HAIDLVWQCEAKVTFIAAGVERVAQSFQAQTPPTQYYRNLRDGVQNIFAHLSKASDQYDVCRNAQFQRDNYPYASKAYGYWLLNDEEKRHDFFFPTWNHYNKKIKTFLEDESYFENDYQVCNYICKRKWVKSSDKDITIIK